MRRPDFAREPGRLLWLTVGCAVLYAGVFLVSIWDDPLIRAPQLDAAEMVHAAKTIHSGDLPAEPFYRSMGYPWLLSKLGGAQSPETYGLRGAVIGILGHLINALLVGWIALKVWEAQKAGLLAGALYAFYPVSLFFAVQLLDVTWGLSCLLAAILILIRPLRSVSTGWQWIIAGLFLGSAIVLRPHFLFAAPVLLVLVFLIRSETEARSKWARWGAIMGCCLPLLIQSVAGWKISGDWHWLPWQGSYNLFAANTPEANGKFFVQTTVVHDRPDWVNPARAESLFRYAQETGSEPPFSIDEMSHHWKARFIETVRADRGAWGHLLLRKFYYSLNDFEQYNNLTYDFHKARWSLLQWNPLGWGVLLLAAITAVGFGDAPKKVLVGGLLLALGYGLSLVLFYASARFRLPLVPLLAVAAGGLVLLPSQFPAGLRRTRVMGTSAGLILAAIITFSAWADVDDRSTHVQDSLLVGNAATRVGNDALALEMADRALTLDESRDEARRLALVSYWNLRLMEGPAWTPYGDWSDTFASWIEGHRFNSPDPALATAIGTVLWHTGRGEIARQIWTEAAARHPDQRGVLDQLLAATDSASKHPADPALRKLLAPPPPTP